MLINWFCNLIQVYRNIFKHHIKACIYRDFDGIDHVELPLLTAMGYM